MTALEFEMALRMRVRERREYQAATLIQAIWKGYYTRNIILKKLSQFKKGVTFITTFMRGKIDRAKLRVKRRKAAQLIQRYMKGYLVSKITRFVKCENSVFNTLQNFTLLTAHVRNQSQRLIRYWWRVYLRVKERKKEEERKRKEKAAAKKKKKKRGSVYGSTLKS